MKKRLKSYAGKLLIPALSILLALMVASILIIASGLVGPEKTTRLASPLRCLWRPAAGSVWKSAGNFQHDCGRGTLNADRSGRRQLA